MFNLQGTEEQQDYLYRTVVGTDQLAVPLIALKPFAVLRFPTYSVDNSVDTTRSSENVK